MLSEKWESVEHNTYTRISRAAEKKVTCLCPLIKIGFDSFFFCIFFFAKWQKWKCIFWALVCCYVSVYAMILYNNITFHVELKIFFEPDS